MKRLFLILFGTWMAVAARADNWAQWRGTFFNGSSSEKNLPASWTKESATWVAPMPGMSAATPCVWGDSVFVTSADSEHRLWLICVNRAAGKVRWQKQLGEGDFVKGNNNLASPSAVTDGKTVFALFGSGDLAALDFAGNVLWARNLGKEFGKFSIMWLYGSSPLLFKDRLYVQVLQRSPSAYAYSKDDKAERDSYLLCIDLKTGKDIWRHIRATDAQEESMESYATPTPYRGKTGDELLVVGGDCVTAHNADTGAELWRCFGLNPKRDHWWRVVPSVVAYEDLFFACGPKRGAVIAIRDGGSGLVTDSHTVWKSTNCTADCVTPLVYQDKLFVHDGDRKKLACLDPKTGDVKWQGAIPVEGVTRASPTAGDGKIYCIAENGTVTILSAGDEFKILSSVNMGEAPCRASIAISDGQLFIRTAKNLYCVGAKR